MTDLSKIQEKIENNGENEQGMLSADEFNLILSALRECQGGIKKIIRNGVNAANAAILCVQMLAIEDKDLAMKLNAMRAEGAAKVLAKNKAIEQKYNK